MRRETGEKQGKQAKQRPTEVNLMQLHRESLETNYSMLRIPLKAREQSYG